MGEQIRGGDGRVIRRPHREDLAELRVLLEVAARHETPAAWATFADAARDALPALLWALPGEHDQSGLEEEMASSGRTSVLDELDAYLSELGHPSSPDSGPGLVGAVTTERLARWVRDQRAALR